ncbi:cytochrome c oxidase assembly factor 5-like [Uloborus diversus]|uniref:cytochrome c oxidase assembly factor 5-like n=1 Tax=Uloborus diversus TaxID=327109 RepID=UPI00240A7929|nr:cytochrome c oxidase assembly factor 5-like [Uloborus diversus]
MATYYEETDEKHRRPCTGVKQDLINCLLASDCVRIEKQTPKQCLVSRHPSVSEECYSLRTLYFECKRSLLDARQRFRGHKGY